MAIRLSVVLALSLMLVHPVTASERRDINPGEANGHRYRFVAVTAGGVAVRQHITVSWENAGAGMLVAVYDVDNPASPSLVAISAGNDRLATLDIGLLAGSYQILIVAVSGSTHYHFNSTYGLNELLTPSALHSAPIDLFTDRLIAEDLAPYLAKLASSLH